MQLFFSISMIGKYSIIRETFYLVRSLYPFKSDILFRKNGLHVVKNSLSLKKKKEPLTFH